jgi:DNA-binding CsgD family transcriptional regulator
MARGESEKASEAIASALEHHQRLPMPFELARTLTVAGEIHRRARRKRRAMDALVAAEAIFDRLGAPIWRKRAAEERSRVGVRTATSRASSSLTEAEVEVAGLAIKGLSNAEIAGRLFMSQRTVQAHLSKIYRKVGVRSRTQLAARFRSEQGKATL